VPQNFFERLCIAGRAVWFYIRTDMIPVRLSLIYTRWNIDEWNPMHWVAPVMVVGILAFLLLHRRTWTKPVLAAYGYVLIVLFPVIGFFNMSFMHIAFVADHLQYIAIPGVIALVAGTGWWIACRGGIATKILTGSLALVLVGLMSYESRSRAATFQDERTLWTDTIRRNKRAWLAYNNLGLLANNAGRPDTAIGLYDKAIALKPDYSHALNNRGLAYAAKANALRARDQAQAARFDKLAIANYDKALECDPQYANAYANKGLVYQAQLQFARAIEEHTKALAISPKLAIAFNNRGTAYFRLKEYDKAIANFTEAIASRRKYADAHHNRALAYYQT
ncbi:hypothetical protein LCGC14_3157360, partial [marine sediment metagenome]